MRCAIILAAATLASHAFARSIDLDSTTSSNKPSLAKRTTCGPGIGKCAAGQCCSEAGYCGKGPDFCKSPQCQMDYSNGLCDANQRPCGKETKSVSRTYKGSVPSNVIIKSCVKAKTVAITFDDGPYEYTNHVLDVLARLNVKATFFITGNNIGKGRIDDPSTDWPQVIRRMYQQGHHLASHTWTHQDLSKVSPAVREQQVIYNEMALRNVLGGVFPRYIRPPYGSCTRDSGCLDQLTSLGYRIVNWDLDTLDYLYNTPETIGLSKEIFKSGVRPAGTGGVSSHLTLSHDIQYQTAYNLTEFMVRHVIDMGYRPVTVGECLGESRSNWYIDAKSSSGPAPNEPSYCKAPPTTTTQPTLPTGLTPSPDGTCGKRSNDKYTCKGSSFGRCCSYNGFCGKSSAYCDGGCIPGFGTCNPFDPRDPPIVSANGLCGSKFHQTCEGSTFGNCCSKNGNCGNTADYCGLANGCQKGFGLCT